MLQHIFLHLENKIMQPQSTMEFCRLCLHSNSKNLVHVLNEKCLIESIKQCTSIEITINDDLPKVCSFCIKKIQDWATFRENCLKSNKILVDLQQQKCENEKFEQNDVNCYSCEICYQNFRTCVEFLDHQNSHDGEQVFKCDLCEKVFSSRNLLVKHDRYHKRPCLECGKEVLNMKKHLVSHTQKYKCSHCPKTCSSKANLEDHIKGKHSHVKNLVCEICGKKFAIPSTLRVHLQIHDNERLYKCDQCDYKGNTVTALSIHKTKHSNENCICDMCSKIFKSKRHLSDHLRRVHMKNNLHECKSCDKKFPQNYLLEAHEKKKHHDLIIL